MSNPYPPPGPPDPSPPSGRGRRLFLAVGSVVVVLAVAGGLALGGTLSGDDEDAASEPTDPTTGGSTQSPTQTSPTENEESPARPVDPRRPVGDVAALERALQRIGYRCYLSATKPIIVRSCYLDPQLHLASSILVQTVIDRQGRAQVIDGHVSHTRDAAAVRRHYPRLLDALRGTILSAADVRAIRRHPNANQLELAWGRGRTFSDGPDLYSFDVVKPNWKFPPLSTQAVDAKPREVARTARERGFACPRVRGGRAITCELDLGREAFLVTAHECVDAITGGCRGRAGSLAMSWGLDQTEVSGQQRDRAVRRLFLPFANLVLDGRSLRQTRTWVRRHLDGEYHDADFGSVHLAIEPNTVTTFRQIEVSVRIEPVQLPLT